MCSVDKNACVLRGDNRFDDSGEIVNIGESFYAKKDIVEGGFAAGGVLRTSDHCCILAFSLWPLGELRIYHVAA